jgi:hypothetical protein
MVEPSPFRFDSERSTGDRYLINGEGQRNIGSRGLGEIPKCYWFESNTLAAFMKTRAIVECKTQAY